MEAHCAFIAFFFFFFTFIIIFGKQKESRHVMWVNCFYLKTINHSKDFLKSLDFQLKIIFNINVSK
jgi:hypothetical protein